MYESVSDLRTTLVVLCLSAVSVYSLLPVNNRWSEYASLCPYNDFCTRNATKVKTRNEQHLVPCCQQCSCDSECQKFGICCPDVLQSIHADIEYPCIDLVKYFNSPRGIEVTGKFDVFFRIVDRCPNSTIARLYDNCQTPSKIGDYIVVTDLTNGRVYTNRHCALCNGFQQYSEWDVITECNDVNEISFETFEERDSYIINHCSIIPVPPQSLTNSAFRCIPSYKTVEERCEYFYDEFKEYDNGTQAACKMEMPGKNTMFYESTNDDRFVGNVVYANIYCYLCGKQSHTSYNDLCPPQSFSLSRSFNLRIDMIMMLSYTSPRFSEPKTERCNSSSIWDLYTESCLKLICPAASIPYLGECRSVTVESIGVPFAMVFNLEVERPISIGEPLRILDDRITSAFGNIMPCGKCSTSISRGNTTSNLYLTYTLYTREQCSRDVLLSKVKQVFKHTMTVTVTNNSHSTIFTLKPNLDLQEELNMYYTFKGNPHCPYSAPITTYSLENCARIDIRAIPFLPEIESTTALGVKIIDNTVCLRDYFMLMKALRNKQGTNHTVVPWWYLCILLCFLKQMSRLLLS